MESKQPAACEYRVVCAKTGPGRWCWAEVGDICRKNKAVIYKQWGHPRTFVNRIRSNTAYLNAGHGLVIQIRVAS